MSSISVEGFLVSHYLLLEETEMSYIMVLWSYFYNYFLNQLWIWNPFSLRSLEIIFFMKRHNLRYSGTINFLL